MSHFFAQKSIFAVYAVSLGLVVASSAASAQTIYYFDPQGVGSAGGSAGTGAWDTGTTQDFVKNGTTGDSFYPPASATPAAYFDGMGNSDAIVGGTVNSYLMEFNAGSGNTVTIDSAAANSGTQTPAGSINAIVDDSAAGSQAMYQKLPIITVDSGNVTINAPIHVDQADGINAGATINNNNTGTLTLNGAITFGGSNNGIYEGFAVNNYGGGSVLFNSTITSTNTVTPILVNGNAVQDQVFSLSFNSNPGSFAGEFNGNIKPASTGPNVFNGSFSTNDSLVANTGILLLDNSNFDLLVVQSANGNAAAALTNGDGITISAPISVNGTIGGYRAGVSTFSGTIGQDSGNYTIVAAAGGKVDMTGLLTGNQDGSRSTFISIQGPGVVDISGNGNNYNSGYRGTGYQGGGGQFGYDTFSASTGSNSDVGTDIVSGTTIISNTSGSAFGGGANQPRLNHPDPTASAGVNNVVAVEAGAALGGTGYSQQEIVAKAATSIITPGEMDQNGISSYGPLHLDNGLSAAFGLTGNFQLGLTNNDKVELSTISSQQMTYYDPTSGTVKTATVNVNGAPTNALTLAGNVVINLSTVLGDAIDPLQTYTLFYSTAGTPWDIGGANFSFTGAPIGYTAYEQYEANNSGGNEAIDVAFRLDAVPEPSTWALFGLGTLIVLGAGKIKLHRLRA